MRPCGTRAIPRATIAAGSFPSSEAPSNVTRPRVGRSRPTIVLSAVVLPAPLGPMRATSSSAWTASETPCRTSTRPYPTWSPSHASTRAPPQVGGDDERVAAYLVGGSLGDLPPEVEYADPAAQAHDQFHVVLDEHDGDAASV